MISYIYALSDPTSGEFRYVGKSNNPERRLVSHIHSSKKRFDHKSNWIKLLLRTERRPLINILEAVKDGNWQERERFWIARFSQIGLDLCNLTPGGDGKTDWSPEERSAHSIKIKSSIEKHGLRKKWSAQRKGVPWSQNHIDRVKIFGIKPIPRGIIEKRNQSIRATAIKRSKLGIKAKRIKIDTPEYRTFLREKQLEIWRKRRAGIISMPNYSREVAK